MQVCPLCSPIGCKDISPPLHSKDAMAWRDRLQGGGCFVVAVGSVPVVGKHGVTFYAPDSEQAGLLARAQDIENFEKQQRARTLIAEETRSRPTVRAEAAYSDAAQRLISVRLEASEAQSKAHELQVETLSSHAVGRANARAHRANCRRHG
jgi:chromosome segregation protein